MQHVKLPSGATMPVLGLGLYKSKKGAETYEAVRSALQIGYRLVDTAEWYRNELDVGRAVRDSGVARSDVFVTTKLWVSHWGYARAQAAVRASNERLGLGHIDLLLLHAPGDAATRADTWRALEDLRADGVVRDIGVSNFGVAHLEKLLQTAREPPAVNQVELHPWLARRELVAFCAARGVLLEAYSPLAKATRLRDTELLAVAEQLHASPAQVLVAFALAQGRVAIPKSVSPARQRENWEATRLLPLPRAVIERLEALDAGVVTAWDPMATHAV